MVRAEKLTSYRCCEYCDSTLLPDCESSSLVIGRSMMNEDASENRAFFLATWSRTPHSRTSWTWHCQVSCLTAPLWSSNIEISELYSSMCVNEKTILRSHNQFIARLVYNTTDYANATRIILRVNFTPHRSSSPEFEDKLFTLRNLRLSVFECITHIARLNPCVIYHNRAIEIWMDGTGNVKQWTHSEASSSPSGGPPYISGPRFPGSVINFETVEVKPTLSELMEIMISLSRRWATRKFLDLPGLTNKCHRSHLAFNGQDKRIRHYLHSHYSHRMRIYTLLLWGVKSFDRPDAPIHSTPSDLNEPSFLNLPA